MGTAQLGSLPISVRLEGLRYLKLGPYAAAQACAVDYDGSLVQQFLASSVISSLYAVWASQRNELILTAV